MRPALVKCPECKSGYVNTYEGYPVVCGAPTLYGEICPCCGGEEWVPAEWFEDTDDVPPVAVNVEVWP